MSTPTNPASATGHPTGLHHVRLTVTDVHRSTAFYRDLFGSDPAIDESGAVDEPGVREDPQRFYGGVVFALGEQLLGLRPAAQPGDTFSSTRTGLDHVSFVVASRDDLVAAAERLDAAGARHGGVTDLDQQGIAILSVQDPDDINLELTAVLG